jgi:hypothetical protein
MSLIKSKQIDKPIAGPIVVTGFTANGGSSTITTVLTTALNTAGNGGTSVPLQDSASGAVGVLVSSGNNVVRVYSNATKDPIQTASGEEVYGKITSAAGVYTLAFFSNENGVETAHSFGSNTSIDFVFNYVYSFEKYPFDAALRVSQKYVGDDPQVATPGVLVKEQLTVTATNTVSNLGFTPKDAQGVSLTVNGPTLYSKGNTHFTVTGQAISFSAGQLTAIGYSIETTDTVFAEYFK